MKNKTLRGQYYGTPVYLRFEQNSIGLSVVYSYRDCHGHIAYEHPHRVASEAMRTEVEQIGLSKLNDESFSGLENVCDKQMKEFFCQMLTRTADFCKDDAKKTEVRARGIARRADLQDLTLGAMIAADYDWLLTGEDGAARKKETVDDDIRALKRLLKIEGTTLWREVTAEKCGIWLAMESRHMRYSIKRLMKKLLFELCEDGVSDDLLKWDVYDPEGDEHFRRSSQSLIREYVAPTMLTYGQCRKLFPAFDSKGELHPAPIDVALVLMGTLGLDAETICGLDCEDFSELTNFPDRWCVDVFKTFERESKRNHGKTLPIQDEFRRRKMPLSSYAKLCIHAFLKDRKKQTGPLIQHPTNPNRRMDPNDLKKDIEMKVSPIKIQMDFDQPKPKQTSACKLLKNTAERELRKAGAEEEELRFLKGVSGKLVSAKHYEDFYNESELNRLGAMQDRWLKKVFPTPVVIPHSGAVPTNRMVTCNGDSTKNCTRARIEVVFPADSSAQGAMELELYALYGFSAEITFDED